jgi:hypothetical protein
VCEPGWLLVIDEVLARHGFGRLHYAEELDLIVVYELSKDGELHVLDVVAPVLPPLDDVLACLPQGHPTARLLFTPDRFTPDVVATEPAWPDFHVMARGPYMDGDAPYVLPELAHC